jgi:hypothetical protein
LSRPCTCLAVLVSGWPRHACHAPAHALPFLSAVGRGTLVTPLHTPRWCLSAVGRGTLATPLHTTRWFDPRGGLDYLGSDVARQKQYEKAGCTYSFYPGKLHTHSGYHKICGNSILSFVLFVKKYEIVDEADKLLKKKK